MASAAYTGDRFLFRVRPSGRGHSVHFPLLLDCRADHGVLHSVRHIIEHEMGTDPAFGQPSPSLTMRIP